MDNIVNVRVLLENFVQRSLGCDVNVVVFWPFSADELNTVDAFFRRIVEVVYDDDLVVGFEQTEGGEGANVSGTTETLSVSGANRGQRRVNKVTAVKVTHPVTRTEPTGMMTFWK